MQKYLLSLILCMGYSTGSWKYPHDSSLNVARFNLQQSVLVVVQVIWACEQLQSLPENTAARRSLGHEAPHCLRSSCPYVNGMLSELQSEGKAYYILQILQNSGYAQIYVQTYVTYLLFFLPRNPFPNTKSHKCPFELLVYPALKNAIAGSHGNKGECNRWREKLHIIQKTGSMQNDKFSC